MAKKKTAVADGTQSETPPEAIPLEQPTEQPVEVPAARGERNHLISCRTAPGVERESDRLEDSRLARSIRPDDPGDS